MQGVDDIPLQTNRLVLSQSVTQKANMAYNMLVFAELNRPEDFKEYLVPGEAVRNIPFTITVSVKNLSDIPFPGGTVQDIGLSTSPGLAVQANENYPVPALKINEEAQIFEHEFYFSDEGLAWFTLAIRAEDDEQIEYLQSEDGAARSNWGMPIFVVSRELITLIQLLTSKR